MAIIKHISVKNRFYSDAVEYLTCKFDEYTNKPILDEKGRVQERDSYLIEGVNCNADTFGAECIETNRLYGKNNSIKDVKAHHYIISFEPTDAVAERKAEQEERRIAEEKERAKVEAAAKEEEVRKAKQIEEERKQREILSRKRKLAFERNNIQHQYYSPELNRPDWNREYTDYLNTKFISDYAAFSEEELTVPIMTREEFEARQVVTLYREKAEKAGLLWNETLSGITSVTHRWKWEYMDYLEEIRFKDVGGVTFQEAKEAILTYEEFAELKELEVKKKDSEQVVDDSNEYVDDYTVDTEIIEQPVIKADIVPKVEPILEDVSTIPEEPIDGKTTEKDIEPEPVDFKQLSIKERAELLSKPTDDIMTEFNAYCKRMGYTEEKMRSIRYKMALYDDFSEEFNYRKKHYGVRETSRIVEVHEKNRGAR